MWSKRIIGPDLELLGSIASELGWKDCGPPAEGTAPLRHSTYHTSPWWVHHIDPQPWAQAPLPANRDLKAVILCHFYQKFSKVKADGVQKRHVFLGISGCSDLHRWVKFRRCIPQGASACRSQHVCAAVGCIGQVEGILGHPAGGWWLADLSFRCSNGSPAEVTQFQLCPKGRHLKLKIWKCKMYRKL